MRSSDHHPALCFIHSGISFDEYEDAITWLSCIIIISFWMRYSIPATKSESSINCWDHHAALFLIQIGTYCDFSCSTSVQVIQ